MAVGDGSRHRKPNDGSSAIDKRYYGRTRKQRVRPAPVDVLSDSPAGAPPAEVVVPQHSPPPEANPAVETSPGAAAPNQAASSSVPPSGPPPSTPSHSPVPSPPSSPSPSAASYSKNQASPRKNSRSSPSQNSGAGTPPTSESPEREPRSSPDRGNRPYQRRNRRNSTNRPPMPDQPRRRSGRARSSSRRRRRGTNPPRNVRSPSFSRTPSSSYTESARGGSSYSGDGRGDGWSSTDTAAQHSGDNGSHRRKNLRGCRASDERWRSDGGEGYGGRYRRRSDRGSGGKRRSRRRGDRQYERRYSRDRRHYQTTDRRTRNTRHSSRSHRGHGRRWRGSSDSDGWYSGREGCTRHKHYRLRRDEGDGRGRHRRDRSESSETNNRRHIRGGQRDPGGGGSPKTIDHPQHQGGMPRLIRVSTGTGGEAEAREKQAEAARRIRKLRARTLEAVVITQRIARGFIARNRVAGRREALAMLRIACLGVAMDVIHAHIREEAAPDVISEVLGGGIEGGELAARRRAEAAEAASEVLEETAASLIREIVTLVVTVEADSHLDIVFARDRRNPLLVVVDDVVAEALRVFLREAVVVEVVKECAEDFMFDKRIFALVDGLIEDGVVETVGPIVSEVYYKAASVAIYLEAEEELCAKEARLVVAETMAPFEDQLVEMQREKDFAAVQAAAQSAIVKGLQLQHAARTVGQRGRLVLMSDINGKTLNLLLAGRFLAILRAAETNRLQVSTSPLLFTLFRRLVVRTGRSVLLEELSRELDRDELTLHALELARIDEVDRQRKQADLDRGEAETHPS